MILRIATAIYRIEFNIEGERSSGTSLGARCVCNNSQNMVELY